MALPITVGLAWRRSLSTQLQPESEFYLRSVHLASTRIFPATYGILISE
jgi:hypothetical protein